MPGTPYALAVLLVAGCMAGPPTVDPGCAGNVCPPSPESSDYQFPKNELGLEQLEGSDYRASQVAASEELVAWQNDAGHTEQFSDIVAYDTQSGALMQVGDSTRHLTRPFVAGKMVAYNQREVGFGAPNVMVWTPTDPPRRLGSALEGTQEIQGIDGTWALFRNLKDPAYWKNGLWAEHLGTGELVQIVSPSMSPDGSQYQMGLGESLADGRAYYALTGGNQTTHKKQDYVMEHDLATNKSRVIFENFDSTIGRIVASSTHAAWEVMFPGTKPGIRLWSRVENRTILAAAPGETSVKFPSLGPGWLAYNRRVFVENGTFSSNEIVGLDLEAGTETILIPGGYGWSTQYTALNMASIFAAFERHTRDHFDTLGADVYGKPLPT